MLSNQYNSDISPELAQHRALGVGAYDVAHNGLIGTLIPQLPQTVRKWANTMTGAFFASMTTRAYDTIILNGTCAYGCGQPVYKDPVLLVSDKLCYLCQMMRLQTNDHKHYIKVGNISTYPETAGMRPIWRNGVHIGWKCTGSEHSGPCNFIRTDATLPTNRTYQFN